MSENVGGIIRLTCGGVGTGKSYLNVKNCTEEIKKGKYKYIYSNIRGHAELSDGSVLPMPEDWRDCEPYSLVIFDEIQMHDKFSKHFSSRRDGEIADLTMIRHKHIDLWLISPNPALVNSDVRNIVNQYYWLEIASKKVTKGWCFTRVYNNVTKTIKNQAYDEFSYSIEEKYYKLYKSTEDGNASGRNAIINFKLISFIIGIVLVCGLILMMTFYLSSTTKKEIDKFDAKEQQQKDNQTVSSALSFTPKVDKSIEKLNNEQLATECIKIEYKDNPQCIEYNRSVQFATRNESQSQLVDYDISKPYEQPKYQYEIVQKPYLVGCMADKNVCRCYTQQATIVNLSKSDCKRYLDGDKPFNPVRPVEQVQYQSNPQDSNMNSSYNERLSNLEREVSRNVINEDKANEPKLPVVTERSDSHGVSERANATQ